MVGNQTPKTLVGGGGWVADNEKGEGLIDEFCVRRKMIYEK